MLFPRLLTLAVMMIALLAASPLQAQDDTYDCTEGAAYPRCLSGNIPSYLAYADDGEAHLEFSLSVKYPLYGRDKDNSIYFSYAGEYDFYLFSRDSAPVESRRQNPGLFFQRQLAHDDDGLQRYRLGWFHESNGQSIDTPEEFEATGDAIDHVSRGWDYLSLDLHFKFPFRSSHLDIYSVFDVYCDCQGLGLIDEKEDEIFWKDVDRQPDIRDYNGLKLIFNYVTQGKSRYTATLRTGTRTLDALSNISYRLQMVYRAGDVPLILFYFNGYGVNLTTYHEKQDYYGIGFEFW